MDMEDEENDEHLSGLKEKKPDKVIAPPVAKDAPDGKFCLYNLHISNYMSWGLI